MKRYLAASAIVAFLVASACSEGPGNGSGPGSAAEPSGTVEFQFEGEQEEIVVYEAVIEAFEKANPKIDIELTPVPDRDEHLQRLTTSMAAGKPPDVFLVNFRFYSQFVARGGIEPFGQHAADVGVDPSNYFEPPVEAFTFDGELQCMPQNISSLVVYYNRRLFQDAGIEEPPDDWTWDDFRSTALALTGGDVRGLGIEPSIIRMAPFVWGNGGELVDDLVSPSRFTLDTPEAREALEFITGLVRDDKVVPTEEEIAAQDLETRFTTDKLGMLLSSRRDVPAFREVAGLDWDVAPLPTGEEPAGILHSDAYCIARDSDNIAAAAEFISFAIGDQGQRLTALAGRTVPSLQEVATTPAFLDPSQAPSRSQVFLDGIPNIRRTPVIPTWPEIEDVAEEILTRMFYEPGYTVERAVKELDEQTRDLLEEGSSG
jgi:multiple sugar transport system substrate-binding protein